MTRWKIGTVNLFALLRVGLWELFLTSPFRGRWSRNKVSVGEPAEGSLPHLKNFPRELSNLFCACAGSAFSDADAAEAERRLVSFVWDQLIYFFKPLFYKMTDQYCENESSCFKLDNNFQQWMSRLAHRWRTLRTAIRNANCRIQWVIEILNAYCTFGLDLEVCLYQCPYIKLASLFSV